MKKSFAFFGACLLIIILYSVTVSALQAAACDPTIEICDGGGGGSCIPTTCTALGKTCGSWDNGCGGTLNCGTCTSDQTCTNGQCVAATTCATTGCSNGYICDNWGGAFGAPYCSCPTGTVQITHWDYTLNKSITDRTYTGYAACTVEVSPGVWTQIQCVDTKTDTNNCGFCGNTCAAGLSCVSGSCQCPTGTTLCGMQCVDTTYNTDNCGRCGNACGSGVNADTPICYSGSCVQCVKASRDCSPNQTCSVNGYCVTPCTSLNGQYGSFCGSTFDTIPRPNYPNTEWNGQFDCPGSCYFCLDPYKNCNSGISDGCEADITSNPRNCGSCGNTCSAGTICTTVGQTDVTYTSIASCSNGACAQPSSTTCTNGGNVCKVGVCTVYGSGGTCTTTNAADATACSGATSGTKYCSGNGYYTINWGCSTGTCTDAGGADTYTACGIGQTCSGGACVANCDATQCVNYNQATCNTCAADCDYDTVNSHCCRNNEYWTGTECKIKNLCPQVGYYEVPTNQCCWTIDGYPQWDTLDPTHVTRY